ncbi:MAG TPA: hypothetical protein VGS22_03005 [Thermoanaerobaculia bacterium]|jgi:hypothetical protein|nr:hypothetical protein [Thermoanaerobaculia bacterium]
MHRPHFSLPRLAVLTALALPLFAGTGHAASADPEKLEQRAIQDVRAVGKAMYFWYRDVQAPKRSKEGHDGQVAAAAADQAVDFSAVPTISPSALTALLVPKYIAKIPATDPWGKPYEFRLNTQDPNALRVMAVRTGGADGGFEGTSYPEGEFGATDFGHDLTWMDGYFVTWPKKAS